MDPLSLDHLDKNERRKKIIRSFKEELKAAELNLTRKYGRCTNTLLEAAQNSKEDHSGDLVKMQLEELTREVNLFERDVEQYAGPHFTKEYRALTTRSGELQINFDCILIDGEHRHGDMSIRRDLICKVDFAVSRLKNKVHDDGQLCEKCLVATI